MLTRLFSTRWSLLASLLACSVSAESSYETPDYVTKHAPIVWMHSEDPYMPSDLFTHLQHTKPNSAGKLIDDELPQLDLDNLAILNDYEDPALDSNDDPMKNPEWLRGEIPDEDGRLHNSTACVVVLVDNKYKDVDAFYFYFYSYDEGPNITQVIHPLERLIEGGGGKIEKHMHFGNHVGDWEHNMIRFKDGKPNGIYYSQHRDGAAYDWGDSRITKTDGRPTVYSARGSHANYAEIGDNKHDVALIDYCDQGTKWDPVLSAYFFKYDDATKTFTALNAPGEGTSGTPPSHNFTSFIYYDGLWGDHEFPKSDPRQATVPKFGLMRFVGGPQGPKFKQLVRKGIHPDHRIERGWMEFWAGAFMAVYPWFIKGWRKWVSLIVVLAAFCGLGWVAKNAITKAMRKYMVRTNYQKLEQEEDIPMENWHRD